MKNPSSTRGSTTSKQTVKPVRRWLSKVDSLTDFRDFLIELGMPNGGAVFDVEQIVFHDEKVTFRTQAIFNCRLSQYTRGGSSHYFSQKTFPDGLEVNLYSLIVVLAERFPDNVGYQNALTQMQSTARLLTEKYNVIIKRESEQAMDKARAFISLIIHHQDNPLPEPRLFLEKPFLFQIVPHERLTDVINALLATTQHRIEQFKIVQYCIYSGVPLACFRGYIHRQLVQYQRIKIDDMRTRIQPVINDHLLTDWLYTFIKSWVANTHEPLFNSHFHSNEYELEEIIETFLQYCKEWLLLENVLRMIVGVAKQFI